MRLIHLQHGAGGFAACAPFARMMIVAVVAAVAAICGAQAQTSAPDAPQPQVLAQPFWSCQLIEAGRSTALAASIRVAEASDVATVSPPTGLEAGLFTLRQCPAPVRNWYQRFTDGPQVKPLTPKEKGWLALRNVTDPFNGITILLDAGIAVGSNPYSPYGPGMPGFARNVGVSYTQDMTGEFFNTFLIPSIVHQDPHYHRMPHAGVLRRIGHASLQVLWTQGDNGREMPNYANIVGAMIDDEISNLYVPGRQTDLRASASRYGIELATAPIDNFVSEFLPDVASRIHVQIVVIQRIINQVAKTNGGEAATAAVDAAPGKPRY